METINRAGWPDRDDRPRVWSFARWPDGRGGYVWHGLKHAQDATPDLGGTYAPEVRFSEDEWEALPSVDDQLSETFQAAIDALAWPGEDGRK